MSAPIRWWTGLSPRRRMLLGGVGLLVAAAGVVAGVLVSRGEPEPVAGRPGAVLLVPGYGGSTGSLDQLATRIRGTGRTAIVVPLAGDGTGDLAVQARVLNGYVNQAIGAGSGPVTVIGYSAGGVIAWLWDVDYGGQGRAGKIVTLGSPLHGARIAAVGTGYDPAECPVACQQLAPGSALLTQLQESTGARPPWLSLWSTDDQTVQPPDSARLAGAVNVPLQSVCPGADIQHSQLPTAPLVVGLVLRELASSGVSAPAPGACASLEALGGLGASKCSVNAASCHNYSPALARPNFSEGPGPCPVPSRGRVPVRGGISRGPRAKSRPVSDLVMVAVAAGP
jgi:triacylglycerol lipase